MMTEPLQLALPFPRQPRYEAVDFIAAASNQAAVTWLARGDWPERRLAIWGQAGCGKTHLVHLWARQQGAAVLTGGMLSDLAQVPEYGALAVDDADMVPQEPILLHLLNTARDRGLAVLLSARLPPARWPVRLPDLSSRLRAMTAIEIQPADDDLLRALLVHALAERQLEVPRIVQDWLLRRLPRTQAALRDAVLRLDRESLASGKPISRSLAARVLDGGVLDGGVLDGRVLDAGETSCGDVDEVAVAPPTPCCQTPGFL
jgi:chromosomal replication initiation ATPase DnaA